MTAIYRYEVPVDGRPHVFRLFDEPLAVGCRRADVVEFWAVHAEAGLAQARWFLVVGTGHTLPEGARYVGTATAPGGALVWHLVEVPPNAA